MCCVRTAHALNVNKTTLLSFTANPFVWLMFRHWQVCAPVFEPHWARLSLSLSSATWIGFFFSFLDDCAPLSKAWTKIFLFHLFHLRDTAVLQLQSLCHATNSAWCCCCWKQCSWWWMSAVMGKIQLFSVKLVSLISILNCSWISR